MKALPVLDNKRVLWLYDHKSTPLIKPYSLRNQFVLKAIKAGTHQLHMCEFGHGLVSKLLQWFVASGSSRENRPTELSARELKGFLIKNLGRYDVLWISQGHLYDQIQPIVSDLKKNAAQSENTSTRVIYDAAGDLDKLNIVNGASPLLDPLDLTAKMMGMADIIFVADDVTQKWVNEHTRFEKSIYLLSRLAGAKECKATLSDRNSLILCCDVESIAKSIFNEFINDCLPQIKSAGFKVRLLVPMTSLDVTFLPSTDLSAQGIEFIDEISADLTYFDKARVMVVIADQSSRGLDKRVQWAAERGVPSIVSPVIQKQLGWSAGGVEVLGPSIQKIASTINSVLTDDVLWQQKSEMAMSKALLNSEFQHDLGEVFDAISRQPRRLVSVHQSKTAGTSFMDLLEDVYAEKLQFFYGDHRDTKIEMPRCFHGHTVMRKDYMKMRRASLVTFLRDPLSRYISLFFYQMDRFDLTEADFIPWLDYDPKYDDIDPRASLVKSGYFSDYVGRHMNYESFDFIGITEHFELSATLLTKTLNWPVGTGLNLQRRANVGKARPKSIDLDDDLVARFKQRRASDYDLYERAKQELFRKARIAGLEINEP
ncbi:MAG TPA: hypothetical protein DCW52_02680 [Gammaproteobacteria bacterium]|nr:sulfotransferase family 2 domain-containing protein [bacterium]HAU67283.1 hypothetical protein [Gammaproteobacteria bacterium]